MKELAGVKCIIDFRIAYYGFIGHSRSKYLEAALELHKGLTNSVVSSLNDIIEDILETVNKNTCVFQSKKYDFFNKE